MKSFLINLNSQPENADGIAIYCFLFNDHSLQEDGSMTAMVRGHKTYKYGPSTLIFNKDLVPLLQNYFLYIRPIFKFSNHSSKTFFLAPNGSPHNTSQMRLYMQTLWRRAGFTSQVGPTLFRKATVTETHLKAHEKKKELAAKMNHSETTASKNYFLCDKAMAGRKVSAVLRSILTDCDDREKSIVSKNGDMFAKSDVVDPLSVDESVVDDPLPVDESLVDDPLPVGESLVDDPLPVDESVVDDPLPVDESVVDDPLPVDESLVNDSTPVDESLVNDSTPVDESVVSDFKCVVNDSLPVDESVVNDSMSVDEVSGSSICDRAFLNASTSDFDKDSGWKHYLRDL